MNIPTVTINGKDYSLSTKLRVAYKVQGQNGHKPYAEIFQQIDSMTLEQQIDILYVAFEIENPNEAKFITRQIFLDHYLDNCSLGIVMEQLKGIISGILGTNLAAEFEKATIPSTENSEGN